MRFINRRRDSELRTCLELLGLDDQRKQWERQVDRFSWDMLIISSVVFGVVLAIWSLV